MHRIKRKKQLASQEAQMQFFESSVQLRTPPTTRYQGSKLKLLTWLRANMADLEYDTVLDAFGGTGCVSYMLKDQGKSVTYNDHLHFNHVIGTAIIENSRIRLSDDDQEFVLSRHADIEYDDFIAQTFGGIYFTDDENTWLDVACQNIPKLRGRFKRALAYYALFQSCIVKRPYNLFHRKNLYMRIADVERSFGNKATWDTPFDEHFRGFVAEANAAVFDSALPCHAVHHDALQVPGDYDLVYIDTPYINKRGVGVDYFDFYHFLEGIVDYADWPDRINRQRKHLPLKGTKSAWSDRKRTKEAFERLFDRYSNAILVVSYRSDGIPSEHELIELMQAFKNEVCCVHFGEYRYVLSTNGKSKELLIIGK